MGGGDFSLGNVVKAVTNPVGTAVTAITGNKNLGFLSNPLGGISNMFVDGVTGAGKNSDGTITKFDESGKPVMADFNSQLGPDGKIKDIYQTQNNYNTGAIDAMRTDALRDPGTLSKWGTMAQSNAANSIAKQQAGQLATATGNLAMQGGLRSGARERLQSQSQQNGLMTKQNAYNQIAMQDETNRLNSVNNLVGQELGLANYDANLQNTNIGRATTEIGQQRTYDMNKYNEAMRAWAAQQTANAMPQTQDKGFIGNMLGNFF